MPQKLSEAAYNKQGRDAKAELDAIMRGEDYLGFLDSPRPEPL